ncbi:MAG: hypothetical protein HEQ33_21370 [Dolichospermum sp. WA123]|nr:hypothetical protein [Dolichospermum sp. WA123]
MNTVLTLTYNQLSTFAGSDNFWNLFDTAFGTQYDHTVAVTIRTQWLSGDFSQLPQIEILDNSTLGNANGAYATSTNKIYLSANFVATATPEAISAVLLEEIGHFIDAQINQIDTPGDEGEKFSALVQGQNLTTQELDRINTENDWANITVGGEQVAVEQNTPIVLTVTTTADQNDGSATGGLSLRDAILIANANTTNDYVIELQGGQTYSLSIKNTASLNNGGDEQAAVRGDLDILAGGKITIKSVGTQKAIIDATNLKTSFASGFGDAAIDVKENAYFILNGVTVTGASIGAVRIADTSTAEISNSLITNNTITVASAGSYLNPNGGGITNYGTLLLKDSTISNNSAAGSGGGIFNNSGFNNSGTVTITNTTISNNSAEKSGGGISNGDGTYSYTAGTITINNTTISGNSAKENGGGIFNGDGFSSYTAGIITMNNTTISGNSARENGGGIFNQEKTYLNNSTITNNTADLDSNNNGTGGGIYNLDDDYNPREVYAKNTIIAGNFDTGIYNPDIYGPINGNDFNLIGNINGASGTIGTGTDIVKPNILLGSLQNNGGTTQTHALLDGSPAINAGKNSLVPLDTKDLDGDGNTTETIPFDQRGTGFSRIVNNLVDIGAFEFQGIPSPIIKINNISIVEGNSGTKTGTVTVTLNAVTDKTVTVNYTTANNNAIAGNDYTATSGQLSFAPGETTKTINVNILGDNIAEANESFFVNLSNPTNAIIDPNAGSGIVTITDDEPHPIILGGNSLPNPAITLTVNTTADQNDGSATGGLSLRDAILIANSDIANQYIINLTGGTTYSLTAFSLTDTKGGDLDILGNVTIQSTGTQPATIDASGLTSADRVFEVSNYLNLSNIVVKGGLTTENGGGIYIRSNATALLFNTTVKDNSSTSYFSSGGGISNGGVLALVNSTVADNKVVGSSTYGGGIYNSGQAILLGTTIKNNTGSSGGGIYNSFGTLTISTSTIYNNIGAGICQSLDSSIINLINSTVSGNQASGAGGIEARGGVVNVVNSTITQNINTSSYGGGGGIYTSNYNGVTVNLKNSIVAGNIGTSPDIEGKVNGNNNNLIGNLSGASGTIGTGTDIVNVNPQLGLLQDNGNGIFTHALLSGSPAINAGNNALVLTDVFDLDNDGNNSETIPFDNRGSGYTRISGGTVDIGAFEFQPAPNLSLSINDVTLTEGNSGTKNATFTVTLSGETFQPVTVNYATANGTATAGSDYTATTGTLIFNVNPGETSKQITVPILGDTLAESDETFFINLSNAINATIADTQGIATITNDDNGSIGNTLPEVEGNNTFATAQVIATTSFNRQVVADIQDFNGSNISTTYDHVSILGTGDGTFDLYRFNALANTQLVFDIDNNNFDTILRLWNPNNNQLLSSNDDGIETGNTGNSTASFLTYKTLTTSDYVIGVYRYSSSALTPPATGDSYTLHLSMLNDDVFTPIESAGNTKLVKDSTNKYFTQVGTNNPIAIKNGGQQIYQDIYGSGWQTIAAETVNGDNQVLWKNVSGNYLHIWHLDNNWNWVSSEGNWGLNSAEALTQETNFSIDANGDGVIGNPYTAIESAGNTKLVKDPTNKYFTQVGTNTPIAIKNGGQQIYQDIYGSGWQTIAAETVNGDNQVLWKNVSGNYLHIWHLDNNWNWVSSEGNWGLNSAEAFTQETNFAIDANGDGVIGSGYTPIESAGNTKLVKDATNKYFTQIGTNTPTAIKNGGQQIYQDIYGSGWQTIAAETVNGDNQVLWKNISGNFLHIWHLDNNWNWVSSEGNWGLNSAEALTQETIFGIDANSDGVIGNPSSLTLTGTSANDFLVGGANNDLLTGGGGKDTLTGGLGADKFVYQNFTDSLLANFDVITDFNATTGNDLFRVSTARAGFVNVGAVNTLDAAGIVAKLTAAAFGSNFAAQFSFGQKTFVAINDATAGFNAANDAIIEVTGLTGILGLNNFTTV